MLVIHLVEEEPYGSKYIQSFQNFMFCFIVVPKAVKLKKQNHKKKIVDSSTKTVDSSAKEIVDSSTKHR